MNYFDIVNYLNTPSVGYNTALGIQSLYLKDLKTLNRLATIRRAAYRRKEHLKDFVILGRIVLDQFGQIMVISKDMGDHVPLVFPREDLDTYLSEGDYISSTFGFLAPHNMLCPGCAQGWTLDNLVDCEIHTTKDLVPGEEGMTIDAYVAQEFNDEDSLMMKTHIPGMSTITHTWKAGLCRTTTRLICVLKVIPKFLS